VAPAVLVGSLLSSRAPDRYIRPVMTFVIFASGLNYAGLGTTALGWILCLVLLACGGYWLARNRPWRGSGGGGGEPAPADLPADRDLVSVPASRANVVSVSVLHIGHSGRESDRN